MDYLSPRCSHGSDRTRHVYRLIVPAVLNFVTRADKRLRFLAALERHCRDREHCYGRTFRRIINWYSTQQITAVDWRCILSILFGTWDWYLVRVWSLRNEPGAVVWVFRIVLGCRISF